MFRTTEKCKLSLNVVLLTCMDYLFLNSERPCRLRARNCKRVRSPGTDSASLCSLAESIPWNLFLGSLKVYKFGLWSQDNLGQNEEKLNYACTLYKTSHTAQAYSLCLTNYSELFYSDGILKAFLVEVSGHKLESSQIRVLHGFLPSFFLSTQCYSWIASSFLASRFFVRIYKTREV